MTSDHYAFHIVDVFAEARFGGNQLAVVTDARGLSVDEMQAIAREFNFAETTFVLPPEDASHTAHVRIFTPNAEMPFAGHPTVGTAAVLAARGMGRRDHEGSIELILEETIGPIRVVAHAGQRGRHEARFSLSSRQTLEVPAVRPNKDSLARALAVPSDAILECWFAGIGTRFCFLRLASSRIVDAAVLDRSIWAAEIAMSWAPALYFFAGNPYESGELHARMFAPALGVQEDAATGSAAAILVGYAGASPNVADGELRLQIRQGIAMGRPSLVDATAEKLGGTINAIHVAGQVVFVAEGSIIAR